MMMSRIQLASLATATIAALFTATAMAQPTPPPAAPAPPLFATTKVDGTDGVYIFRYEIYSHSHYDHIAGGKPFKDAGATFVAHENAKTLLAARKNPDIVMPDETIGNQRTITLGGTSLELNWVGKNHGADTLIMRLPREKIIFTVDWIPINGIQFRGMADTYIPDIETSLEKVIAMDWDRMIPGHPGPGGRLGTKDDARAHLQYLQDLSAAVKQAVNENKSYTDAQKDIKLPKYEKWPNYNAFLP